MVDAASRTRINSNLRKARERAGKSLEEVATYLGITTASLSRMETGVSGVTADRIETLAQYFEIGIADLFEGQLVAMPTTVDLDRLRGVVILVQTTISKAKVKPSPEKIADVVTQVYQREIERLLADPGADAEFDATSHEAFVEMVFKK